MIPARVPEHFTSDRLDIRAPRPEDASEVQAAVEESVDALREWMSWAKPGISLAEWEENLREAQRKYRAKEDFRLQLFLRGTDTFVGESRLHNFDWSVPRFEIGYWVRKRFLGQGYATEAVRAIADFAFDVLGARRVEIRCHARNERSGRVAERAGFELEGTLRNRERHPDGSLRDTRVYSRIR